MSGRRALARAIVTASLLAVLPAARVAQSASPKFGRVTTVTMPRGREAEAVLLADVDGDGSRDLVVATSGGAVGKRRELLVYLHHAGAVAFAQEPDEEFPLLPDVVGIAVADVHADPGNEIVLFTPAGAFALRPHATGERERYVELAHAAFLWQLPDERRTLVWQRGVRDLNGDGLADLVLPLAGGYAVAMQRRAPDGARSFDVHELRLPADQVVDSSHTETAAGPGVHASRHEVSISIGLPAPGSHEVVGDLVDVDDVLPAPRLADWDGDGRIDLLSQTTTDLLVWRQRKGGAFPQDPDESLALPIAVDRGRLLDVSFSAHAADLDGDGRADYVLVAGDRESKEPQAQVAVYRRGETSTDGAHPLFGSKGIPVQVLVVAGLAGGTMLTDVNGDGLPDLVMGTVRLDAVDKLRMASGGTVNVEMDVWLDRRGSFSRRPDLTWTAALGGAQLSGLRRGRLARFVGDVTGDGIAELLVRSEPGRVRLFRVRRAGDELEVEDRALFETAVDENAEEVIEPAVGGQAAEAAFFTERSVLVVELGP